MNHPAPATLEIILNLKQVMRDHGMTQEDVRVLMNAYLPVSRQIKPNHSGAVQLSRWLNPTGKDWSEPKSEIILAFQKVAEEKKEEKNS
jgi:hypothetical protein